MIYLFRGCKQYRGTRWVDWGFNEHNKINQFISHLFIFTFIVSLNISLFHLSHTELSPSPLSKYHKFALTGPWSSSWLQHRSWCPLRLPVLGGHLPAVPKLRVPAAPPPEPAQAQRLLLLPLSHIHREVSQHPPSHRAQLEPGTCQQLIFMRCFISIKFSIYHIFLPWFKYI